jgi:hypothetical protein
LLQHAFSESADVVCILDADEFLPFNTQQEFKNYLKKQTDCDGLKLSWKNVVPGELEGDQFAGKFLCAHEKTVTEKIMVFRSAFDKDPLLTVSQGNHDLISDINFRIYRDLNTKIIHVPVRSFFQFAKKAILGGVASAAKNNPVVSDDWVSSAKFPFRKSVDLVQLGADYSQQRCDSHILRTVDDVPKALRSINPRQFESHNFENVITSFWSQYLDAVATAGTSNLSEIDIALLQSRLKHYEGFVGRYQRSLVRRLSKFTWFRR